jgi:hypothetical protein
LKSRVRCKKSRDIIEHRIPDTRISTSFAIASGDYVPECHPLTSQLNSSGAVREVTIDLEKCFDNLPEVVFFIPVILLLQERLPTRKTPEYKHICRPD